MMFSNNEKTFLVAFLFIPLMLTGSYLITYSQTVYWGDIADKPSIYPTNWSNVADIPNLKTYSVDWSNITSIPNLITYTVAWINVTGKPSIYPTNWGNIADKPSTYPPSTHSHSANDITSDTLSLDRIPVMDDAHIPNVETLSYGGTFAKPQIPVLDSYQYPQALLLNGSRAMTGSLTISGTTVQVGSGVGDAYLKGNSASGGYFRVQDIAGSGIIFNRHAVGDTMYFGEVVDSGAYSFRGSGTTTLGGGLTIGNTLLLSKASGNSYVQVETAADAEAGLYLANSRADWCINMPSGDTYLNFYRGGVKMRLYDTGALELAGGLTVGSTINIGANAILATDLYFKRANVNAFAITSDGGTTYKGLYVGGADGLISYSGVTGTGWTNSAPTPLAQDTVRSAGTWYRPSTTKTCIVYVMLYVTSASATGHIYISPDQSTTYDVGIMYQSSSLDRFSQSILVPTGWYWKVLLDSGTCNLYSTEQPL